MVATWEADNSVFYLHPVHLCLVLLVADHWGRTLVADDSEPCCPLDVCSGTALILMVAACA